MNNNKDPMDQIITEDLLREAEAIDEEIEAAGVESMPSDIKEKLKQRLHEQIEATEKERVYAQLSDEDKKALELGRRMLKESEGAESDGKVVYRRKKRKIFLAVAAVAVLVLAMGITSIGGAERIVEMIGIMVRTREVVQVNTDENNYIAKFNKEEEAYQELREVFGVDPVKLIHWPGEVRFLQSEIDDDLQTAILRYEYTEEIIDYYISSHHTESSWGIDVEDEVLNDYVLEKCGIRIEIKEYKTDESQINRFSAKFSYNSMDYFLIGTMQKEEMEYLVENLNFL